MNHRFISIGARIGMTLAVLAGLGLWLVQRQSPQPNREWPSVARTNLAFHEGRWCLLPRTDVSPELRVPLGVPYTGWMLDYYPSGLLLSRAAVSNGLLNGVTEGFYTNGQLQIREQYKNSLAHGRRQKWYENGQLKSEATIVEGRLEGPFYSWHENGQLAEKIEMKGGSPDGEAWAFYASGFAKAETHVRAGRILNQTTWEDGQHPGSVDSASRSQEQSPQ